VTIKNDLTENFSISVKQKHWIAGIGRMQFEILNRRRRLGREDGVRDARGFQDFFRTVLMALVVCGVSSLRSK